jgi:iron(III) transport system permease protein
VWDAIRNSVVLGLVRTCLSLPLAMGLGWLIARSDLPGRGVLEVCCWLAIFLPVLPLTYGWIFLLDPRSGFINNVLNALFGVRPFNIYGFWGITWVHLATSSVYFQTVLLLPALRHISSALEEAAYTSGASPMATLRGVTLPLMMPAVLSVGFLGFVRSLEVFEVELILGVPAHFYVYSTLIFDLVRNVPPQLGLSTAIGCGFLLVMIVLALLQQRVIARRQYTTVTGRGYLPRVNRLGALRYVAAAVCFGYIAAGVILPGVFLVVGSFMTRFGFFALAQPFTLQHWTDVLADPAFGNAIKNTLMICVLVTIGAVVLYSTVAYLVVRRASRLTRLLDLVAWLPWAVPGVLLSLAMLWLIVSTPLRSVLYGSVLGIAVALVITDSPISTQTFKASLLQIGHELEEAARASGAGWLAIYRRILFPLLAPTAAAVGLLVFMSAAREVSTPALLYTGQTEPVALLMLEYGLSGYFEEAAAIGVLMMAMATVVMLVARRVSAHLSRVS